MLTVTTGGSQVELTATVAPFGARVARLGGAFRALDAAMWSSFLMLTAFAQLRLAASLVAGPALAAAGVQRGARRVRAEVERLLAEDQRRRAWMSVEDFTRRSSSDHHVRLLRAIENI